MSSSLQICLTGGTISQRANQNGDKMDRLDLSNSLPRLSPGGKILDYVTFSKYSGAGLAWNTVLRVRQFILENRSKQNGFLVVTGTDALEEFAFVLDLLLPATIPVVLTGAAKPWDTDGFDGIANFNDSLRVLESPQAAEWTLGTVVVINDCIHPARYLRKQDSALMGMFQSHPGPIGQLRCGEVIFYYTGLPLLSRDVELECPEKAKEILALRSEGKVGVGMVEQQEAGLLMKELALVPKVAIWHMALQAFPPPESLLESLDGLIVAGMGTGSISQAFVEQLSPKFTSKIPVVLTSRTAVGMNYDDFLYKGSVEKYERMGFVLRVGHSHLNPLQARLLLTLRLLGFNV